ncbi:hypothetical protein TELCIR_01465 [Teladorsagia circumcincta]|uniref:Beta-lactamase-related domain-containing protein n=1 Tax=Teladorsagia circumcincta TaxID=45464 RepID=A0A2G9V1S9_TELCI|nr:hypothetical protein TELCIR_01465 [Teladorsagia circumcincta]
MFWQALFAVAVVVVLWWKFSRKRTIKLHGEVHPSFEHVREKFSAMIQQDNEGAALAVLHQGKVVVHLFGGYANRENNQPWIEDTMAIAYSTTKIWAALTSAILAGRGLLHYDENPRPELPQITLPHRNLKFDLDRLINASLIGDDCVARDAAVTTFWPGFGKNGKGNTTIRDVLDHRAGLITFGREFGLEEAKDSDALTELIETTQLRAHLSLKPNSKPGYLICMRNFAPWLL